MRASWNSRRAPPALGAMVSAAISAVWLLLSAGIASAYPQMQFSSGASRCNQCHFSPAGGGLLTGFGRDAAGEELSTVVGDGAFLHGAVELPSWLALGADLRGALLAHDAADGQRPERVAFPMQADVHARGALPEGVSIQLTLGVRGQARSASEELGADNYFPASPQRFVSREHYVMWRDGALGPYARAGRFFAPFGLRLAEHSTYVRRDLGFATQEETYGLSGGYVADAWELHVTGFVPDFVAGVGGRESGFVALAEHRPTDTLALGLNGRLGHSADRDRWTGGGYGKIYVEALATLLQAEIDFVKWRARGRTLSNQLIAFAGATVIPVRGLWLGLQGERNQSSLSAGDSGINALNGQINWFPYPHVEALLLGRLQAAAEGPAVKTALFILHYYL